MASGGTHNKTVHTGAKERTHFLRTLACCVGVHASSSLRLPRLNVSIDGWLVGWLVGRWCLGGVVGQRLNAVDCPSCPL